MRVLRYSVRSVRSYRTLIPFLEFFIPLCTFQVAVLAAHWGDGYYHFVVEGLPRIMVVLDVLLEHRDIKVRLTSDLVHRYR